jgi:hypothetical protein
MPESFVQVAPDSTGKKIRNLQVSLLQADGSVATVQMQVIAIADEDGNPIAFKRDLEVQQQHLDELRAIRIGMQLLVDWLNPLASTVQPAPINRGSSRTNIPLPLPVAEENELIDIAQDLRQDDDL